MEQVGFKGVNAREYVPAIKGPCLSYELIVILFAPLYNNWPKATCLLMENQNSQPFGNVDLKKLHLVRNVASQSSSHFGSFNYTLMSWDFQTMCKVSYAFFKHSYSQECQPQMELR